MKYPMILASAIAAISTTSLVSIVPLGAREKFYPGWESHTIKMMAFEGCMFDYGFGMQESAAEKNRYWKSLGSRVTSEMEEEFSSVKGWEDKYNDAINDMTAVCHEAARRIEPGIFKIDYTKGGKRHWISKAMLSIAFKECIQSDSSLTTKLKDKLLLAYGANKEDIKNVVLREKHATYSGFNFSGTLRDYGAGSAKCKEYLQSLRRLQKQDNYILNP
jgi:hypothetical protein